MADYIKIAGNPDIMRNLRWELKKYRGGERMPETDIKNKETLQGIVRPLLDWYDGNARDLPWRKDSSPYRVWISEIMLQQTRVEAGKTYFLRWMEELPDIGELANVSDEKLMKLWEGLGYYNRARNLKKAAGIVMEKYGGTLPGSYEALLSLPGIGTYTAGAVGSIAFGLPVAAVDGNVLRVAARLTADKEDIGAPATKKKLEQLLLGIIPADRPGDFNQALMELGAIVCIPNGAPKCDQCPLSGSCQAHSSGMETMLPVKAPKKARSIEKRTITLLRSGGRVLLHRRNEKGLLAGLWELPGFGGELAPEQVSLLIEREGFRIISMEALPPAKHIFSHIEWHMTGFAVDLDPQWGFGKDGGGFSNDAEEVAETEAQLFSGSRRALESADKVMEEAEVYSRGRKELKPQWAWVEPADLQEKYALPSAFRPYMEFLREASF